jgi:hypothetical protein
MLTPVREPAPFAGEHRVSGTRGARPARQRHAEGDAGFWRPSATRHAVML